MEIIPQDFSSDVLSDDAISGFKQMIDAARANDRKHISEAQAKRDRRKARNLLNSNRSCGVSRCRGNVA